MLSTLLVTKRRVGGRGLSLKMLSVLLVVKRHVGVSKILMLKVKNRSKRLLLRNCGRGLRHVGLLDTAPIAAYIAPSLNLIAIHIRLGTFEITLGTFEIPPLIEFMKVKWRLLVICRRI